MYFLASSAKSFMLLLLGTLEKVEQRRSYVMFLILIINTEYVTTFSVAFDIQKHFCLNKSKAKSVLK